MDPYQFRPPVLQTVPNDTLQMCRQYKGLNGLRQLIRDQAKLGMNAPKCGWRWKPSTGINAFTSQGAYGVVSGPIKGGTNEEDTIVDGTQWFTDLDKAEQKISQFIASKLKKCVSLNTLASSDMDSFGFCTTTKSIIPIERDARGMARPRFSSPGMTCDPHKLLVIKK
jgi:hypothetical protein